MAAPLLYLHVPVPRHLVGEGGHSVDEAVPAGRDEGLICGVDGQGGVGLVVALGTCYGGGVGDQQLVLFMC